MTDQHPITPPPELVQQWAHLPADWNTVALLIAQWGADQELEATLAEVSFLNSRALADRVRAARRPKPPSLKEQALIVLDDAELDAAHENIIRRALEALPDD
jgi:hypothetical protein